MTPPAAPRRKPRDPEARMSFWEHIQELRKRIVRCALAVGVGVAISWYFRERILGFITAPLRGAFHRNHLGEPTLHFLGVVDPFVEYFKLSLIGGVALAAPLIFWELWGFVAPGLYAKEKKYAIPFAVSSSIFFVGGAAFGYYGIFPYGFDAFLAFSGTLPGGVSIAPTITLEEYLDFSMQLLAGFGIVFELPLLITFLALAGVVNWRQLLRFSRWFIPIAFFIAGVLTPPDVGSQILMAVPLCSLYFLSILLAYLFGPKVPKEEKKKDDDDAGGSSTGGAPPRRVVKVRRRPATAA